MLFKVIANITIYFNNIGGKTKSKPINLQSADFGFNFYLYISVKG